MAEGRSRFDKLVSLTPQRFHISENPPFDIELALCGRVNADDDSSNQFCFKNFGIPNCKLGIWTSIVIPVPGHEETVECILRWVEPGTIGMKQSMEEWIKYEEETGKVDAESWEEWKSKNGWEVESEEEVKWRRDGQYYDDGGLCNVISTEYLTREACGKIHGGGRDGHGNYLEMLTLSAMDGEPQNSGFCIGSICFGQDAVGSPPTVSVVEKNGQVVAVRIHSGYDDEDGDEDGNEN